MSHYEFYRKSFDELNLFFQGWLPDEDAKGVICLIHGLGEHSGRYEHWAALLNSVGYALITYDLRGHGKSDGKRGHASSFDDYLKDTDILLKDAEDKFPGKPCFLYGHSLGGLIVNYYVLTKKPKLAGVIVTALSNNTSLQEQKAKILLSKILGSLAPTMTIQSGLVPSTISRDPEVVERYINDPLVHHQVTVGWGKSALEVISWSDQHASEWTLPVLYMHGEKDVLGYSEGSRAFSSKIKGDCTLKIWPGLYHEVHNEPEKEQVFTYLHGWLDKHIK
jgi:alpha-beta hydrolase superfamily lysophospholipase